LLDQATIFSLAIILLLSIRNCIFVILVLILIDRLNVYYLVKKF